MNNKKILIEVRNLFALLNADIKSSVQFCFECNEVTFYAEEDACTKCDTKYNPNETNEVCPKCGCEDFISFCEKCGSPIDVDYIDGYLFINEFEWEDSQLETIKEWCINLLK